LLPEDFRPNGRPPPLRAKYIAVSNCVNKLVAAQVVNGTVLLLPLEEAMKIRGIHFSCQHWAPNKGKPQGRIICDVANPADPDEIPINGAGREGKDKVREAVELKWGSIDHPTLVMIMRMILVMADKHGWENITVWKMDLKGAFNLLWFGPRFSRLLAFPLTDGNVATRLAGMFGWVGMPFVFQVITRAILALILTLIVGMALMYVDDIMGCSPTTRVDSDMDHVFSGVTGLMGLDSIEVRGGVVIKNEVGRDGVDMIGWDVNIVRKSVSISKRNLLKTLFVFFQFDINDPVSLEHVERMASLASRLSQLCRAMRPYTAALFACIQDYKTRHTLRRLPGLAKVDVCVWRAFLVMCRADPDHLYRPIESFRERPETLDIEYDASLWTLAVGVSDVDPVTMVKTLLGFCVINVPFPPTTDPRYQNTYEFLAVVVGVMMCMALGIRHKSIRLLGDSVLSLKWALQDRVVSTIARRSNIVYTLTATEADLSVDSTIHVPGKENTVYDGLTRGKTAVEVGLDPNLQFVVPDNHPIHELLVLCDPMSPIDTMQQHAILSNRVIVLLQHPLLSPTPFTSSASRDSISFSQEAGGRGSQTH
jgi:hypothetical protein